MLFDSSPNASAQYISASFLYRRPSRSDFVTTVRRAYSFALARYSSICDLTAEVPRAFCSTLTCRCKPLFRALPYFQGQRATYGPSRPSRMDQSRQSVWRCAEPAPAKICWPLHRSIFRLRTPLGQYPIRIVLENPMGFAALKQKPLLKIFHATVHVDAWSNGASKLNPLKKHTNY
jgi:hypothetical protein